MRRGRWAAAAMAVAAVLLVPAERASADGLPVLGVDASRSGLTDGAGSRFVTAAAGGRSVLARIEVRGGRIDRSRLLRGRYTIPAVAYDGTAGGISADGATLVLISPRAAFPRKRTTLLALDTGNLTVDRRISLRGDFSFDAISPDGGTMFLIHYLSQRDMTRYEVRALDLSSGRLLAGPIVDPSEAGEEMRGMPVTRAESPDGRWAYTLYDGAGHEPFVHALDTVGRTAVCIDLPALEGRNDLYSFGLDADGGRSLLVRDPTGAALLAVDTRTFAVEKVDRRSATGGDGGSASPVWIGAAALALLLALVAGVAGNARVRSRPQGPGAGPAPEPDPSSDPDPRVPAGRA